VRRDAADPSTPTLPASTSAVPIACPISIDPTHACSSSQLPPPDPPPASQRLPPSTPSHSYEQMSFSIVELKEAITKVEESIAKLQTEINALQTEINALQPQITEATEKALKSGDDKEYWREEKQTLRNKEQTLRNKDNHLCARLTELEKQKGHLLAQSAGGSQVGLPAAIACFPPTPRAFLPTTRFVRGGLWPRVWVGQRRVPV